MAQSQYLLLSTMVATIVLLALWLRVLRTSYLEPAVIFLGAWSVIVSFVLLGLVTYDRVLTVRSCVFLVASIAAFVAGTVTVKSIPRLGSNVRRVPPCDPSRDTLSGLTAAVLGAGSLVYLVIQAIDIGEFLSAGGLQVLSLADVRSEFLGEAEEAISELAVAKAIARATALMLAAAVPVLARTRRPWLAVFGVVSAIALLSESMLAGGRVVLVYVALSMIYLHLHALHAAGGAVRLRLRRLAGLGVLVTAMFYGLLVIFPAARNPTLIEKTDLFLGYVHTVHVSDWVWKLSEVPAFASLPVFAFASSYLSQPIVKYTFFIEESDIADWHMHGSYNFPVPAKIVSFATTRTSSWLSIRADLAQISEERGFSGNPWATGVRDLNIDFGLWGTVLAMFLFGTAWQWLYEKATRSSMLEWRILCALAAPVPFFFAFFSPFPIGAFSNTIFIALAWATIAETAQSRRRPVAGTRNG